MSAIGRRALVVLAVVGGALLLPAAALAHPLGNFTVNTSAGIVVSPGSLRVDYAVDMAEIPTVQAMPALDADGDGAVSADERSAWASARAVELRDGLEVRVDGGRVALDVVSARAELLPGQGGLDVLRVEATFSAGLASSGALTLADRNFDGRVGWHEVFAVAEPGVALGPASVPSASPSDGLHAYPDDLLSSPLDVREATLTFAPGRGVPALAGGATTTERPGGLGDRFTDLVGETGWPMVAALALAFGFGALHALGPGHGKALMAAYLVGAGARATHAVAAGGAVALMHTASVLALGLVVLSATEVLAPERAYPILGVASGLVALGLGIALLAARLGRRHDGDEGERDHGGGDHGHPHGGRANDGHAHGGHDRAHDRPLSRRGLVALAVAGGVLPSPTALVVLLGSVALHRVAYGLALIAAFSLGLAAALAGVGLVAMRARDVVAPRLAGRLARAMPIASAAGIVVVGAVLTLNGVAGL